METLSAAEKAHLRKPVLVVFNKKHEIVQAGDPRWANIKDIAAYLKDGFRIKTMTLAAFNKLPNKWATSKS